MANQQQLDLLKQGVAATWNTWKAEHPDTVIELNGVDLLAHENALIFFQSCSNLFAVP
jgi:hypothetical protein